MNPPAPPPALHDVETPVGVVDLSRARSNAERVVAYAAEHGLAWRPHIKTHKSIEIARLQIEAGARGLTVATLHEAEVMAAVTPDLLLAYPVVGSGKLRRLQRLLRREVDLRVGLDSEEVLGPLAQAADAEGREVGVLVEVDAGLRRVGIGEVDGVVRLAEAAAAAKGARYGGIMFYAGHIRGSGPEEEDALLRLAGFVADLGARLDAAGLTPEIVSGGTTPTLWSSHRIPRLTEIRPGTCIYNDRDAVAVGAATPDQWAYTVLATVVSTAVPGRAAVDAGSKALAKEERGGSGYGELFGRPEVKVVALSEEHGMLDLSGTEWRPEVGERVRIVPNHVCVSVNLQDRVVGIDGREARAIELEGRGRASPLPEAISVG